ncbi:MAG TPA: hypothetical protein VGI66_05510 [Streptosporangiaceae bacterium]|jgi:hypothetical protein
MIKSLPRRAAVVLAGGAIGLTAVMLPAQAAANGWRVSAEIGSRGSLDLMFGVDAVSARDAWATGFSQSTKNFTTKIVLRHWTGASWHEVSLPARLAKRWNSNFLASTPAASSARDVWVFDGTPHGGFLHLSGTRWSMGTLPGGGASPSHPIEVLAAKDFGRDNTWAYGARVNLGITTSVAVPYAFHFNGRRWTGQTVPGKGAITAVSAVSPSSVWAVVGRPSPLRFGLIRGSPRPLVLHWTAATDWQRAAVQPMLPAGANLTSVVAQPDGTVWIGGSVKNGAKGTTALVAKWTTGASAWTLTRLGGASSGKWTLADMVPAGRGGIVGLGVAINVKGQHERLWQLTGSTWSRVTPNFGKPEWTLFQLAAVPGTASVWGVGAISVGQSADGLIAIDGPTPR